MYMYGNLWPEFCFAKKLFIQTQGRVLRNSKAKLSKEKPKLEFQGYEGFYPPFPTTQPPPPHEKACERSMLIFS